MMIPRRKYGVDNDLLKQRGSPRLPRDVPIIGLGCSSFSNLFSNDVDDDHDKDVSLHVDVVELPLDPKHARVREWINTVREAIGCGVNLIDTAPWYGHGISESLIGLALTYEEEEKEDGYLDNQSNDSKLLGIAFQRDDIVINTKVGRYDADPKSMFDFSASRTRSSVLLSISRMKCEYINVIQLHDPEFAPSIDLLLDHTIPELCSLRNDGLVKAIGITGYPLEVQHEILLRNFHKSGRFEFDQSLTYCHFNLHDQSLFLRKKYICDTDTFSFYDFCSKWGICVTAAAPLSMGLFTQNGPPKWHPASPKLKKSCENAVQICNKLDLDVSDLAILFALSRTEIPCTLIGIRNRSELRRVVSIANRFSIYDPHNFRDLLSPSEKLAFDEIEKCFCSLPFAEREWDGKLIANVFWRQLGNRHEA